MGITFPLHTVIQLVEINIIYNSSAFWPIPISGLVEKVPPSPFFVLHDNETASKEFGQLAFLGCAHSTFVDVHLFIYFLHK
jgi:hypothetical protein